MEMDDLLIQRSIGCKITEFFGQKTFHKNFYSTQDSIKNL